MSDFRQQGHRPDEQDRASSAIDWRRLLLSAFDRSSTMFASAVCVRPHADLLPIKAASKLFDHQVNRDYFVGRQVGDFDESPPSCAHRSG
jgi:hypothetical protein